MSVFDLFKTIEAKRSSTAPKAKITHLCVGLGNTGAKYDGTRHNAGFAALDVIAEKYGAKVMSAKYNALCGECEIAGHGVLLMKPQTYMNLSGDAVWPAASFYKIPPENIIVLCDDVSFDVGKMRIRMKGSHGGHNGLRDITAKIGSENFCRIKIGVGKKPHPDYDLADFVLGKITGDDKKVFDEGLINVCAAVELILQGKYEEAMNKYNR
ncbi:MAG: aminoacyl-tRNA hydrolase [Clostridia bacterium]|nr:aminoacyl-tRNA hydrolase [Clostridia bacterium]